MADKMTLEEYLGKNRVSFPVSDYLLDKMKFPHGLTERQRKKFEKDAEAHEAEYAQRRQAAIEEYHQLVADGKIIPKTRQEVTIEKAIYGHPDNEATQAARRLCDKRGIDWRSIMKKNSIN